MDKRLVAEPYLAGAYSIADMACCPRVAYLAPGRRDRGLSPRPPWRDAFAPRSALQAAYARAAALEVGYERKDFGTALMPWDEIMKHVITV